MKILYFIDEASGVVLEIFSGELEKDKILNAVHQIWADPKFNANYDVIIDLRVVDKGLKLMETLNLLSTLSSTEEGFRAKVAILVSDPRIAAQAELYGESAKSKHSVQVFISLNEALEYVGAPDDIYERGKGNFTEITD